jgi:DNA polymerase phi
MGLRERRVRVVASNVYKADKENFKKIGKVYLESMSNWDAGEVDMQAVVFTDWVNWVQSHRST